MLPEKPQRRSSRRALAAVGGGIAVAALAALWWTGALSAAVRGGSSVGWATSAAAAQGSSNESLDVTFLVSADTHFGATTRLPGSTTLNPNTATVSADLVDVNDAFIHHMNRMAGRTYPPAIGGRVAAPRGLLVAGDLTEDGIESEWKAFAAAYGHDGRDGRLRMPVYAVIGNHDKNRGDRVARSLDARHGGAYYTWQWGALHLIALSEGPDAWGIEYLRKTLAKVGRSAPVILWFHYPLRGPFSRGQWFGDGDYRSRLASSIAGHRIVAIFHGHYHGSGYYRWGNFDVYSVGSPKHHARSFAVVHVTSDRLTVCSWNVEGSFWWWWHSKSIDPNASRGDDVLGTNRGPNGRYRPAIPYPVHR